MTKFHTEAFLTVYTTILVSKLVSYSGNQRGPNNRKIGIITPRVFRTKSEYTENNNNKKKLILVQCKSYYILKTLKLAGVLLPKPSPGTHTPQVTNPHAVCPTYVQLSSPSKLLLQNIISCELSQREGLPNYKARGGIKKSEVTPIVLRFSSIL